MSEPIIEEDLDDGEESMESVDNESPETDTGDLEDENDVSTDPDDEEEPLTPEEETYLLKLDANKIRSIQYGPVKTQLLQVLQEIKVTAEQGFSSIELELDPHPQLQEELLQRGFTLYIYSRTNSDDKFMKISW